MRNKNHPANLEVVANQKIKERNYWLDKLSGEWVKSTFPYSCQKEKKENLPEDNFHLETFRFSGELFSALMTLSTQKDIKLYIILAAGLVLLVNKYNTFTGEGDITIGSPIYKQDIDGEFVNTVLILRNQLQKEMTFKELLLQVRQTIVEANDNCNYPVEVLAKQLGKPYSKDDDFPLFDIVFLLENIQDETYIQHINCNVRFLFKREKEYIEGVLEYNPLLYDKWAIEKIINHFTVIFQNVLFNLDLEIFNLDILSEDEKQQILKDFNATQTAYPQDKTIHELFGEQAEKTPDGIALVGSWQLAVGKGVAPPAGKGERTEETGQLTYGELNKRSDQVARLLCEKGVGPDTIVGIMVERSIELIIGIMGILKAGGAYLPIDLNYPQERTNYMLKDSNVRVLLKKSEIRISKSETNPNDRNSNDQNDIVTPIVLNFEHLNFEFVSNFEFRASNLSSSNLVYVIYTSGTTGRPKGVAVEHRSLVNASNWHIEYYRITETDIVSQYASIVFDASVIEIFPCLTGGAVLHIIPEGLKLELDRLNTYLEKNHITVCFLPTQICEQFLERENHSLRVLVTGGDKLRVFRKKSYQLHNNYGPTENTVVATVYRVAEQSYNIPIGKPVYNNRVYILSIDRMHLQPIGVVGELCIAGDSLARGYLNNPELTAKKFIDPLEQASLFPTSYSPTHPLTHSTIYRTGDLARWLADGNIEFLGRWDNQVKTRGYRIELGEIEYHLKIHTEIKEVVVVNVNVNINRNVRGKQCLCAYFVPRQSLTEGESEKKLSITDLKKYLAKKLPDYMIPAYFVQMDNIPLTVNGKVNRKMLPQPREIESQRGSSYVAPETGMQRIIADTWKEVLGRDEVGIRDNFFDLGGNSLDFIMVSNKLQEKLKREIPVVTLFTHPTIGSLEEYLGYDEGNEVFEDSESQSDRSELVDEGKSLMQQTLRKLDEED